MEQTCVTENYLLNLFYIYNQIVNSMIEIENQIEEMLTRIMERVVDNTVGKSVEKVVERVLRNGELAPKLMEEVHPDSAYYTRKDIENKLNVTTTTVIRWERDGKLKSEKINGRRVYDRSKVDNLIKSGILLKYGLRNYRSRLLP